MMEEDYEAIIIHLKFMLDLSREREESMSKRVMECESLKKQLNNLEKLCKAYSSEIDYLARILQNRGKTNA